MAPSSSLLVQKAQTEPPMHPKMSLLLTTLTSMSMWRTAAQQTYKHQIKSSQSEAIYNEQKMGSKGQGSRTVDRMVSTLPSKTCDKEAQSVCGRREPTRSPEATKALQLFLVLPLGLSFSGHNEMVI